MTVRRLTSEEHYRIAEKLLGDEQYLASCLQSAGLHTSGRLRELAQIHASLATAGITREDVERLDAEDRAELEALPRAELRTVDGQPIAQWEYDLLTGQDSAG